IASAFFWLTRYEEALIEERDEFDRVPQARLLVVRENLAARALVDEYSELLAQWLEILGEMTPRRRLDFRVALTHDVDSGLAVNGLWEHADNAVRTTYRELFRQRRPRTAIIAATHWAFRYVGYRTESDIFAELIEEDHSFGFPSFFFIMANGVHP